MSEARKNIMRRFMRAMTLLLCLAPAFAHAETYDGARYEATLKDIAGLQAELVTLAERIEAGLTPDEARPLAARADDRLDWLRATFTEATMADRATLRARDATPHARCIVWRAGDIEDHAQDVATDLAMIARGAKQADLIPLDGRGIAAEGVRKGC